MKKPRLYYYFILPEQGTKYMVLRAKNIKFAALFFAHYYGKTPFVIRKARPLEVSFYRKEVGEVATVD